MLFNELSWKAKEKYIEDHKKELLVPFFQDCVESISRFMLGVGNSYAQISANELSEKCSWFNMELLHILNLYFCLAKEQGRLDFNQHYYLCELFKDFELVFNGLEKSYYYDRAVQLFDNRSQFLTHSVLIPLIIDFKEEIADLKKLTETL